MLFFPFHVVSTKQNKPQQQTQPPFPRPLAQQGPSGPPSLLTTLRRRGRGSRRIRPIRRIPRRLIRRRLQQRIARPSPRRLPRHRFRLRHLLAAIIPLMAKRLARRIGRNGGETARLRLRLRLQWLVAGSKPVTLAVPHGGRSHGLALTMATAGIGVAALLGVRLALARVLRVGCRRPGIGQEGLRRG